MGGMGVSVGLVGTTRSDETLTALHREIWRLVAIRIRSLVRRAAGRNAMSTYLSVESSDGYRTGSWYAAPDRLHYRFGDAGGRCVAQMSLAVHWTQLALLDQWPAIKSAGAVHGLRPTLPGRDPASQDSGVELDALLSGRSDGIVLAYRGSLMRVSADEDPQDARLRAVPGDGVVPLSAVGRADRSWISQLIREGRCGCEPCQRLREARGLPLAPQRGAREPQSTTSRSRQPSTTPPPPRYELAAAPMLEYAQAKRLRSDPAEVVALNLAATWSPRTPATFVATLPRYPLRALNLRRHGLRGVPPAVLACRDLEVLSLRGCRLRQPLPNGLRQLTKLRALDLTDNFYEGLVSPTLFALNDLEILDYSGWHRELPREVFQLPRLRHLDLRGLNRIPADLAGLPLESLVLNTGYDPSMLARLPVRYLELLGSDRPVPACPTLEHVALTYPGPNLPVTLRTVPPLRGLQITREVWQLPAWLADAHAGLQVLRVDSDALGDQPDAFRVIERLTNLRVLVLQAGWATTSLPLDLSGLQKLEVLAVSGGNLTRATDLPRGIHALPNLRTLAHTAELGEDDAAKLRATVPNVVADRAGLWDYEPRSLYRATTPRGGIEWYLARFAEPDWVDLPPLS